MDQYERVNWTPEKPINVDNLNKMDEGIANISKSGGMPIGSGMDYYGSKAPENYMFADGSAISRTDYAELFAIIGTAYGAGDGSTTFNLPDKRSRVSVMKDSGTFNTLGKKGGEETHKLTTSEMPSHNHNFVATLARNSHVDKGQMYNGGAQQFIMVGQMFDNLNSTTNDNSGTFISSTNVENNGKATISNTGSGTTHNNLQPYIVCNYIIKVK